MGGEGGRLVYPWRPCSSPCSSPSPSSTSAHCRRPSRRPRPSSPPSPQQEKRREEKKTSFFFSFLEVMKGSEGKGTESSGFNRRRSASVWGPHGLIWAVRFGRPVGLTGEPVRSSQPSTVTRSNGRA